MQKMITTQLASCNIFLLFTVSESNSEKSTVPQTPVGMAPPPPLRNIPHQTPDTSPTASLLLGQVGNKQQLFSLAAVGGHGARGMEQPGRVVKLPTKISVLPNSSASAAHSSRRQSYPNPASGAVGMVGQTPSSNSLPGREDAKRGGAHDSGSKLGRTTPPYQRVIPSGGTVSPPLSTSTPKSKRALFPRQEPPPIAPTGKLEDSFSDSNDSSELKDDDDDDDEEEEEEEEIKPLGGNTATAKGGLFESIPTRVAHSAPHVRNPPRLPMRKLMTQDLSASSYSESSLSTTDSDNNLLENERRDKFDPGT